MVKIKQLRVHTRASTTAACSIRIGKSCLDCFPHPIPSPWPCHLSPLAARLLLWLGWAQRGEACAYWWEGGTLRCNQGATRVNEWGTLWGCSLSLRHLPTTFCPQLCSDAACAWARTGLTEGLCGGEAGGGEHRATATHHPPGSNFRARPDGGTLALFGGAQLAGEMVDSQKIATTIHQWGWGE